MTIAPKEEPLIHEDSKKTFQSTFQTFGKKTKKKKIRTKEEKHPEQVLVRNGTEASPEVGNA